MRSKASRHGSAKVSCGSNARRASTRANASAARLPLAACMTAGCHSNGSLGLRASWTANHSATARGPSVRGSKPINSAWDAASSGSMDCASSSSATALTASSRANAPSARARADPSAARPSTSACASASERRNPDGIRVIDSASNSARASDCSASVVAPVSANAHASDACQLASTSRSTGAEAAARATNAGSSAETAASNMASNGAREGFNSAAPSARRHAAPGLRTVASTPAAIDSRILSAGNASIATRKVRKSLLARTKARQASRRHSGCALTAACARTGASLSPDRRNAASRVA